MSRLLLIGQAPNREWSAQLGRVKLVTSSRSGQARRGAVCAAIPHPSGVNAWWNDPDNRRRASVFLRAAFNDAARGRMEDAG